MPDLQLSLIVSCALVLQILTFPNFFLTDLFSNALGNFPTNAQLAAIISWIVLVFVPPVLIMLRPLLWRRFSLYLAISVSIWPVTLLLVRLAHLARTGDTFTEFHLSFPIFLFSDVVVPALYWSMALHALSLKRLALGRQRLARKG